jgi:hypothetical protein
MPSTEPLQATARSPFAGCLILILALLMMVFLIGFTAWMPFRQAAEIEKFTATAPAPLAVDPIDGNETKVNDLVARLETFRNDLQGDAAEIARIELTPDDLNLAIAAFTPVEQLRESFRVREITADALVIDICYKLNGRPRLAKDGEDGPLASDPRYLIGTIQGRPQLMRHELVLKVEALEVPGHAVPEGFMNHFSTLRIFEASLKDPLIGPSMAAMTRATLEDGKMILARIPGEVPPDVVSDADFKKGGGRLIQWFGVAACIFLVFAALMVFYGIRRQKKAEREAALADQDGGDA